MAPTPARRPVGVVERRQAYVKSELRVYLFIGDFYVILFRRLCSSRQAGKRAANRRRCSYSTIGGHRGPDCTSSEQSDNVAGVTLGPELPFDNLPLVETHVARQSIDLHRDKLGQLGMAVGLLKLRFFAA
jgi:hypothetical protein